MGTRRRKTDDGVIGLGVLALLIIAFIAGQMQHPSGWSQVGLDAAAPDVGDYMLIGDPGDLPSPAGGGMREFRIVPSAFEQLPDFDWSSDETLLERYGDQAF